MAMGNISSIANGALQAFSTSQQITANNVANISTDGFKASRVTFQTNDAAAGVSATVTQTEDSVDISREAVNLISNTNGFKANLNVIKVTDEMTKELLNIKA
jgi:flagellar hook protein FlgE